MGRRFGPGSSGSAGSAGVGLCYVCVNCESGFSVYMAGPFICI